MAEVMKQRSGVRPPIHLSGESTRVPNLKESGLAGRWGVFACTVLTAASSGKVMAPTVPSVRIESEHGRSWPGSRALRTPVTRGASVGAAMARPPIAPAPGAKPLPQFD